MRGMKTFVILLAVGLLLGSGCRDRHGIPMRDHDISLIRLLANPERFHSQPVAVTGYLVYEFENHALYPTKDIAEAGLVKSSVWLNTTSNTVVDPASEKVVAEGATLGGLNRRYVVVWGTYDLNDCGHMSAASGSITADRIAPWLTQAADKQKTTSNQASQAIGAEAAPQPER